MKTLKMKNKFIVATLLFAAATLSQSAIAGTNSPGIDQKQGSQTGRIFQGVDSGELTRPEALRLGLQQGKIYHKEQHFKADGNFTRRERAAIHRDLLKSSKNIYGQKHDSQIQGGSGSGIKNRGINKRQHKQTKRIGQGIRSGSLTRGEAARLGHQQVRIQKQKRRLKADGTFTKRERARVHKSQNRASKNIYRKKHNGKTR